MRLLVSLLFVLLGLALAEKHTYKEFDNVPLIVTKLGPYANPSEIYQYYSYPFCKPDKIKTHGGLEKSLQGERHADAPYEIHFLEDVPKRTLCPKTLDKKDIKQFSKAIREDFYFMMLLDGLPVWDAVGRMGRMLTDGDDEEYPILYTHVHFDIGYNGDRVVAVQIEKREREELPLHDLDNPNALSFEFTYSVKWYRSDLAFNKRMSVYSNNNFGAAHLEIHWFSILNAFGTVLLLTGFLSTILMRILRKDFIKYASSRDDMAALDDADLDESGWKLVHADVFRFPPFLSLYCSLMGVGCQLLLLFSMIFSVGLCGAYVPYEPGYLVSLALFLYAFTSFVSGYISCRYYTQMGGVKWAWNTLQTMSLLVFPLFLVWAFNNSVAWAYHSSAALPAKHVIGIFAIFIFITFPATILGAIAGKRSAASFDAPCRTNKVPRQIPPVPWYRRMPIQILFAGFLPFSAIYIELYYIFAAAWGHRVYTIYYIACIVYFILLIVTSFITIALTYFQLVNEDYRWWWQSFFNGGSTGIFVFMYCLYYYWGSDMHGFFQTCFFFGYMFVVCYAIFIMLGFVGSYTSLVFVRYIYRTIKSD